MIRELLRMPAMHLESWLSAWLPYRPEPPARQPDAHYRRLRRVDQLGRYSMVAGYCEQFLGGGAVLDVGCGEGLLARRLVRYTRYVGVDNAVLGPGDERTHFVHADAAGFEPAGRFDVIVFNESLYYFADPLGCLRRYSAWLDGVFIVSMYCVSKNRRVWQRIERAHEIVDAVRVSHGLGRSWDVKVLRPIFTTPTL